MTRNRQKKPVKYVVLAASAAIALLFTFCRSAAPEAAYPIERGWRGLVRAAGSRIAGAFRGAAASAENAELRRQIAALSLLQGECERLERENARLRSALEYRSRLGDEWLAASVISRGGGAASVRDVYRIDRGSSDGIVSGALAVTPAGLVGVVGAVTAHTAELRPLTDPELRVACEIRIGSGATVRGILSGGEPGRLFLRHVISADGVSIPERSSVYTSGLGGVFPAGIAVGSFTEVLSEEGAPARAAAIEPAVDFDNLEDVFIRRER